MVLYADDTTLIFSENDRNLLLQKVINTMDTLNEYFSANDLLLNIDKTQTLYFGNRNNENLTVHYRGNNFVSSDHVLFLGINIDKRLDWRFHINSLALNIARYSYALRVISENVCIEAALTAYHAYVHSRIRYGIIFWGNSSDVQRVLVLQKRCLRAIYKMKQTESCKAVFINKKVLTTVAMYIYEAVIFVSENKDLFESCDRKHEYHTRLKNCLIADRCKYSYIQKNVQYSIIKIYNNFPLKFQNLQKSQLKKILKNYLFNKPYYTLQEFYDDKEVCKIVG